jgi:hypothetical protein
MNRQPPAFLERLAARLLPRASREHVLGDLSERYTSPARYIIDAGRTIPFVVGSQLRRLAPYAAALAARVAVSLLGIPILLELFRVTMRLEPSINSPGWFSLLWLLCLFALLAGKRPLRQTEEQPLERRIATLQSASSNTFVVGVFYGATPFLQILSGRMSGLAAPTLDGQFSVNLSVFVILCLGLVMIGVASSQLRSLEQQLEQA